MRSHSYTWRRRPWGASILAAAVMLAAAGCDELLQVKNPNNIAGDDILDPNASNGMVNGALSGVARGFAQILTSYSTATDEFEWSGSRDAFQELDFGTLSNPFNEFLDEEFPPVAQGRWMADEAIRVMELHCGAAGADCESPAEPIDLARAHLYRAISYIYIGDMFEDWAFSDRQTAAAPVGPANMGAQTYGRAITSLGTAISIAQQEGDSDLELAARAVRARANHGLAVWQQIRAGGTGPVASDVADANFVIANGDSDYKFGFQYSSAWVSASISGWIVSRQEMRVGQTYASPNPSAPTYEEVILEDLIDAGTVSPELKDIIDTFHTTTSSPFLTIASTREMHLIVAENALAGGGDFTTPINALRALDGLTAYSGQVDDEDLLVHSRQTNLYLQGRRLADHYRFGVPSREWQNPDPTGTFFPITVIECRANEFIPDSCN